MESSHSGVSDTSCGIPIAKLQIPDLVLLSANRFLQPGIVGDQCRTDDVFLLGLHMAQNGRMHLVFTGWSVQNLQGNHP